MTSEILAHNSGAKKGRSPLYPKRLATEYALLGLLLDGPGHGYDLARQFAGDTQLGKVCRLEMSMIYGLLKKLEREGMSNGKEATVPENKSRRIVELTPAGRAEFENWLAEPVQLTRVERNKAILHIEEIEILDGTPLLDIKPYVPRFDNRETEMIGWFADKVEWVEQVRSDQRFHRSEV